MRRISILFRKYFSLSVIVILLWIVFYIFLLRFNDCYLEEVDHNPNGNIYSYFKAKSFDFDNISITLPNNDVLLVIRTSKNSQALRMPVILKTWFQFSPNTTYITTNGDPKFLHNLISSKYHHHVHTTTCKQAHSIRDLCCHSASEFNIYFQNQDEYKWLCRFDDDQYVNVPLLIDYLKKYSPDDEPLYIGKPSMTEPKSGRGVRFWFATYGGGVCFSRSLLNMIRNDVQPDVKFMEGCISSNYPDDTHIAYVLRLKYKINLTIENDFHHHIERGLFTNLTNPSNIDRAITLGFKGNNVPRFVPIVKNDVFHMQTLHCLLYPDPNCMRLLRILLNKIYMEKNS